MSGLAPSGINPRIVRFGAIGADMAMKTWR